MQLYLLLMPNAYRNYLIGVSLCIYVGIILSNRNIRKENSFLSFFAWLKFQPQASHI